MHTAAYEVRGLRRCYRGGRRSEPVPANDGIDLDIPAGGVFGVLGPNGAGKSTLIRQLVGLLRPDAGTVHLFGAPIRAGSRATGGVVAYLAQDEPALDETPVGVAISTTARLRGCSRVESHRIANDLLAELDLGELADRPLGSLSGGQRRLACVAVALAGDRPVLVLDEPAEHLDDETAERITRDLLAASGDRTVVLITHRPVDGLPVDQVVHIADGAVTVRGRAAVPHRACHGYPTATSST